MNFSWQHKAGYGATWLSLEKNEERKRQQSDTWLEHHQTFCFPFLSFSSSASASFSCCLSVDTLLSNASTVPVEGWYGDRKWHENAFSASTPVTYKSTNVKRANLELVNFRFRFSVWYEDQLRIHKLGGYLLKKQTRN